MLKTILKTGAITIAFTGAGVGISVILWALEATGNEVIPGHHVENWIRQGAFTVIYSLLAGFLVDAIRWLTGVAWLSVREHVAQGADKRRGSKVCLSD